MTALHVFASTFSGAKVTRLSKLWPFDSVDFKIRVQNAADFQKHRLSRPQRVSAAGNTLSQKRLEYFIVLISASNIFHGSVFFIGHRGLRFAGKFWVATSHLSLLAIRLSRFRRLATSPSIVSCGPTLIWEDRVCWGGPGSFVLQREPLVERKLVAQFRTSALPALDLSTGSIKGIPRVPVMISALFRVGAVLPRVVSVPT